MATLAARLVKAGLAAYPPWSRCWVSLASRTAADAVWLFELAHARASGTSEADLHDRIFRCSPR
jgi:hypothetical protein